MRNSSSLDWLRFMHTPNDYRVSHNKLRECGEYKNGHRVGRWKLYTIDGKLEREWDEN